MFYKFARSENPAGRAARQRVILHGERRFIVTPGGSNNKFVISLLPGREYLAGAYDITDIFLIRNFDALIESGLLEFKVPRVCLATGCVSRRRD